MVQEQSRIQIPGSFACDKCTRTFASVNALNGHSSFHAGQERYRRRRAREKTFERKLMEANKAAVKGKAPVPGPLPTLSLLERVADLESRIDHLEKVVGH